MFVWPTSPSLGHPACRCNMFEHSFCANMERQKDEAGNPIWLRRSRLVAREYTWLRPGHEALFSPASSNIATRILPICFLGWREHQETLMLAIDVKDAFLTVQTELQSHTPWQSFARLT